MSCGGGGDRLLVSGARRFVRVALFVCVAVSCGSGSGGTVTSGSGGEVGAPGPRWDPALAWTGREVLVFGGSSDGPGSGTGRRNDGLLLTPDLTSSRPLPPSPFELPLVAPSAAASGGRVYVAGIMCSDEAPRELDDPPCEPGTFAVASYDPEASRWRRLDAPDVDVDGRAGVRVLGASDDGRVVVAVSTAADPSQVWLYSPDDSAWEAAPADGGGSAVAGRDACVAGTHVVLLGSGDPAAGRQPIGEGVVAHVLDLGTATPTWSTTDPISHTFAQPATVACHPGGAVVTAGGSPSSGAWSLALPSMSWHKASAAPVVEDRNGAPSVYVAREWIGTSLFFASLGSGEPGLSYDPAGDRWSERAASPGSPSDLVWTGEVLIGPSEGPADGGAAGSLISFSPS